VVFNVAEDFYGLLKPFGACFIQNGAHWSVSYAPVVNTKSSLVRQEWGFGIYDAKIVHI
jgi:hypothetical protein